MYLGIEIGGTKLQLGVGPGDGRLLGSWRGAVDVAAGANGIRRQIVAAVPSVLASAEIEPGAVRGVGVGFGGPVDDATRSVIKSHQIDGWDGFPLADWLGNALGLPAVLGNDADVAGLAEALFGAGRGSSPVLYMTIGSGIGGGLIDRRRNPPRHRPRGRRNRPPEGPRPTRGGWRARKRWRTSRPDGRSAGTRRYRHTRHEAAGAKLIELAGDIEPITAETVAAAANDGDPLAEPGAWPRPRRAGRRDLRRDRSALPATRRDRRRSIAHRRKDVLRSAAAANRRPRISALCRSDRRGPGGTGRGGRRPRCVGLGPSTAGRVD